ncbi:MAG: hypothetical protein ACP5XB_29725 [Isosphaeraceae bacterium]
MLDVALPPFVSSGDSGASFYTLAYCRGTYGIQPTIPGVFLTLNFTTSPDFTRYSLTIRDADGRVYLYSRGEDSLEYVLLSTSNDYAIPPAFWQLYPLIGLAQDAWGNRNDDRDAYLESRGRLCRILWRFRIHEHLRPPSPFTLDPSFVPPSLFDAEPRGDAIEINTFMVLKADKPETGLDV